MLPRRLTELWQEHGGKTTTDSEALELLLRRIIDEARAAFAQFVVPDPTFVHSLVMAVDGARGSSNAPGQAPRARSSCATSAQHPPLDDKSDVRRSARDMADGRLGSLLW